MRKPEPLTAVNGETLLQRYATAEWEVVDCEDGILRPFCDSPTPSNYGLITVVSKVRLDADVPKLEGRIRRLETDLAEARHPAYQAWLASSEGQRVPKLERELDEAIRWGRERLEERDEAVNRFRASQDARGRELAERQSIADVLERAALYVNEARGVGMDHDDALEDDLASLIQQLRRQGCQAQAESEC